MKRGGKVVYFSFIFFLIIFLSSFANATTRSCWSCGNCTAELGNATAGDIVQLNQSISNSGSCIDF